MSLLKPLQEFLASLEGPSFRAQALRGTAAQFGSYVISLGLHWPVCLSQFWVPHFLCYPSAVKPSRGQP